MSERLKQWVVGLFVLVVFVGWLGTAMYLSPAKLPEPLLPRPARFTDLVQISVKGVVHIQCPSWQGSGFVVGPRLIVTARHCVEGVEDFLITTHTGCQVRATRAHSTDNHDVGFVWVDDLECVNKDHDHRIEYGGEHDVVLTPLRLGNIDTCKLGQSVYSIGSTFGKAHFNAIATGIIQTLDLDIENFGCPSDYGWAVLFSNTAEGAGGNSGCPLFTLDGKVIGVWVGSMGNTVHYCIPVNVFSKDLAVVDLLFAQDRYKREEAADMGEWYNYREGHEYY